MEQTNYPGHLILIVSVPGGGKSTLIQCLKEECPQLQFAVSCTSRDPRPGEVDGENYYFLSPAEFERRIEAGDFLEWIQQDGGRYYGTLKSEIIDRIADGEIVVREVEIRGVRSIRELVPRDSLTVVFITAGSWDDMRQRILDRAPITEEELEYRRGRYEQEIQFAQEADLVIENRNGALDEAKEKLTQAVDSIIRTNNK